MKLLLPLSESGRPILAFIAKKDGDLSFLREDNKDKVVVSKDCYALIYHGMDYSIKDKYAVVSQDSYFFAIDAILTLLDLEDYNKYEHFLPVKSCDGVVDVEWRYN